MGKSFKPKEKKGYLPLPATFNNIQLKQRNLSLWIITFIVIILWLNPLGISISLFQKSSSNKYPEPHPFTSPHKVTTTSKYIFPPVEHAPLLKELGRSKLVKESRVRDANHPEIDVSSIVSLNAFDNVDPSIQLSKEKDENAASDLSKAKNTFKNGDKIVYKPKNDKNYPEIVIVTAIDFEKYSLGGLTNIVQNRIDYAHDHNYGVYIRWYEEFLPWINSFSNFDNKQKKKWIRTYCLRAAMFAFPKTKWFWYFDEDGLIMDTSINLKDYVLKDDVLSPIMLREQPINPQNGIIKTYKSSKPGSVKLIITQSNDKIETNSFIIKNDDVGRSILEFWTCDLFFEYPNFPFGPDSALTHILQWHPFLLSKTAIIPARTIAARHSTTPIAEGDHLHYVKGDFTVSWTDCKKEQCEATLAFYNSVLHPASS
ncbi:probable alpha-1,6-mannosyltransferase Mnn11p [[Candida] jaroonii]|uniref:Probable alpha-1,6-mannosyltransferase Mnn11p n=1 Tax=[Candida] jaroonii TaxID=467808 RepID=A0ACA9Y9W1_9ASCO|nr:probable alpha-1,6-mannosyltransferase Mnn11p [[Candida] jaroonii]